MELQDVVYGTLRRAWSTNLVRDFYFPDALIMLALFKCMTEGWQAAIEQCVPFAALAYAQINSGSISRDTFRSTVATEAFRTVLTRYVRNEYAEPLVRMFEHAQAVMRNTVVDLIESPLLEHVKGPIWRRVYLVGPADWYMNYKPLLEPITDIATDIPHDILRVEEVVDNV